MIEGARRIGKSTIVTEFARNEYEDYLLLDFVTESIDIRRNFKENLGDLDTFFRNLFLLKGKSLSEKKSVIIMDEIQFFPAARQAIKYLTADGRYDYIETGSLISIKKNVRDILIPSEEYRLRMFPMDFEEFLWAKGDHVTFPVIRDAFEKRKPLGDAIHRKIMQHFRTYMAVGGMPQAVDAFVSGKNYEQIDFVKRNILSLYEEDLKKYDEDNREKASAIYKTIPEQLENHNSHFKFSMIDKNARYKNYVDAVDFIEESMIGHACIGVTCPEVALELYADRSNFKLYMGDTGLLVTQIMGNTDETGTDLYKWQAVCRFHRIGNFSTCTVESFSSRPAPDIRVSCAPVSRHAADGKLSGKTERADYEDASFISYSSIGLPSSAAKTSPSCPSYTSFREKKSCLSSRRRRKILSPSQIFRSYTLSVSTHLSSPSSQAIASPSNPSAVNKDMYSVTPFPDMKVTIPLYR